MMSGKVASTDDATEDGGDVDTAVGHHEPEASSEDDEGSDHEGDDDDDGDSRDEEWEELFNRLVQFKSNEGHCLVPFRYKHDRKLGKWGTSRWLGFDSGFLVLPSLTFVPAVVASQRKLHEKVIASGQKTPADLEERFRRLDEVGFEWKAKDPRHVPWSQRYGELVDFVARYGHAQVPIGWKENPKLSNWVSAQVRLDVRIPCRQSIVCGRCAGTHPSSF
jgi:Helicase associated domain